LIDDKEEDHGIASHEPLFSVTAIVQERVPDDISRSIGFTWGEFQELFNLVQRCLHEAGRGRRRRLELVDRFCTFLLYFTSSFTSHQIGAASNSAPTCIAGTVEACLCDTVLPLEGLMPTSATTIRCHKVFENFPIIFRIVNTSPRFINLPSRQQEQYYSGKFKRHFVGVQTFVIPDGQYICLSQMFRGSTHDKAMLDHSGVVAFLTEGDGIGQERTRMIMTDLGDLGIQKNEARAVLPHKRGRVKS
jgi:hypothetical protein